MQVDRKVLEQALEALDAYSWEQVAAARTAIKAALEQPIIHSEIKEDKTWHGLTDEERDYFKACGFVGVSRVEEVLRAKNSTPLKKRSVTYVCPVCAASLERQE